MLTLTRFFALTFAATWACWGLSREITSDLKGSSLLAGAVFLLGTFAPALVALALTNWVDGRDATKGLIQRVFKADVGVQWYVFAIAYIPALKLSVAGIHRIVTGTWPRFGEQAWYVMAAAIAVSMWVQAGEEIGWRGYALPRLSERIGLPTASIILGIIWAGWHLPLFLVAGFDTSGQSFPLYLLQVTALSVALAWLYWRTEGSLLLVMLLHASVNNTKDIVPSAVEGAASAFSLSTSLVAWLTVALLWVTATYFLFEMRHARIGLGTHIAIRAPGVTSTTPLV